MAGLFTNFAGFQTPAEDEIEAAIATGCLVLDTNVLLDLYGFEEPARVGAFEILAAVQPRLFVPHQVMKEFWRNRPKKLYESRPKPLPIDQIQQQLSQILNSLNPDKAKVDEVEEIKTRVAEQLRAVGDLVSSARGKTLDVELALSSTLKDPIVQGLVTILDGRVGEPFSDIEELEILEAGRQRFSQEIPPGYADESKPGQREEGMGDFILWEQALRHLIAEDSYGSLVMVTGDSKMDWRMQHPSGSQALGVRPELVEEAVSRTGRRMYLLLPTDFYRLVGRVTKIDASRTDSVVAASDLAAERVSEGTETWTARAYAQLLRDLRGQGSTEQADVIVAAARNEGSVGRSEVYEICGFDSTRSLKRFALPTHRIAAALSQSGTLDEVYELPLVAIYEGPGKAVGYGVPMEFVIYQERLDSRSGGTWLEDAADVMRSDPSRWWSPEELVKQIADRGIRDLSFARTPEKTLRRDLAIRGAGRFERTESGYRLTASALESPN